MNEPVIFAQQLRKSYDTLEAVKGIDFFVQRIFNLLGLGGATARARLAGLSD